MVERITIWKSDLKDNLVSQELAKLFLEGKVKVIYQGKNFIEIEYPQELYFKIYPKYGVSEKPLKSFKELWIWEKREAKTEFEGFIVVDKLNLSSLKKVLPNRWYKFLSSNDEFRNWIKNPFENKIEVIKKDYIYKLETDKFSYKEFHKDNSGKIKIIVELHDDFIMSDLTKDKKVVYIYLKKLNTLKSKIGE